MSSAGSSPSGHPGLESLYQEHHGWLQGWLRQRLNNRDDAADLAQDTFVRVLLARSADTLRQPRQYLATVARGMVIDLYRRRSLEQAWLEVLASQPEEYEPSAQTRAIVLEALMAIDRMLDGLGSRTRAIFLAVQVDGLSYEKAALRVGVSVSTVRKHLANALLHCLLLDAA